MSASGRAKSLPRRSKSPGGPSSAFLSRWLAIVSDPDFVRLDALSAEPNFFRIVGRAHFERWHSAFIGWLLDPLGSHLTRTFPLLRLLLSSTDGLTTGPTLGNSLRQLAAADFVSTEVTPSEMSPVERSVNGVGRFDIFATGTCITLEKEQRRFNLVVEIKIDSAPDAAQAARYAQWLHESHPQDMNALIYISPNSRLSLAVDPTKQWAHLSFQALHDKVLLPMLEHPGLNPVAAPFLAQYIKNLRHAYRGQRMALTEDQRRIALALYERHHRVFDELLEVLSIEGVVSAGLTTDTAAGRQRGRIAVRIGDRLLEESTVSGLFGAVLRALADEQKLAPLPLPWGDTSTRYLLTNRSPAEHPNGRPFFYPVSHGGYTMETHYSRGRAMRALEALCGLLGVPFEVIETKKPVK